MPKAIAFTAHEGEEWQPFPTHFTSIQLQHGEEPPVACAAILFDSGEVWDRVLLVEWDMDPWRSVSINSQRLSFGAR